MASHQNQYASVESACNSPLARYLRRTAGVGVLKTYYAEDIARDMGYSRAHANQVVIASLIDLQQLGVIKYVAEKGRGASLLIRVLL